MKQPDRIPMTRGGFEKLREELNQIKSLERPKLVGEIEEALGHGDLSENAEYHAAKDKMSHLKGRMHDLELIMSKAEIIDPLKMKGQNKVMFGAHVTLMDLDDEKKVTYQLVGEHESDVALGRISVQSPIGKALIGKTLEDEVAVKTPRGVKEFEVVEIDYK